MHRLATALLSFARGNRLTVNHELWRRILLETFGKHSKPLHIFLLCVPISLFSSIRNVLSVFHQIPMHTFIPCPVKHYFLPC